MILHNLNVMKTKSESSTVSQVLFCFVLFIMCA